MILPCKIVCLDYAVQWFRNKTGATPSPAAWQMTTFSSNMAPTRHELGMSYALAVLKAEKNKYAASLVYDDLPSIIIGLATTRMLKSTDASDGFQVFIDFGPKYIPNIC